MEIKVSYRGGASLWELTIESAAFDSYSGDDLPQLPALLTSVSNSIAGSVLPPSVCEGALPYARGRFTSE